MVATDMILCLMNSISDIHTHHLPAVPGAAVYCLPDGMESLPEGHLCSIGLHPWNVTVGWAEQLERIEALASSPAVAAIGEAGLDRLRGPELELQTEVFLAQARLAEHLGKPLIIHSVRCTAELLQCRRLVRPEVPWLVHGFRGGIQAADELRRHGIWLSFGFNFNPETLAATPENVLLLESDDLDDVSKVYNKASALKGIAVRELEEIVAASASRFLNN